MKWGDYLRRQSHVEGAKGSPSSELQNVEMYATGKNKDPG